MRLTQLDRGHRLDAKLFLRFVGLVSRAEPADVLKTLYYRPEVFGAPFVPVQYYKISDGTGEMTVIANDARGVPRTGAHVRVKGRVAEVASFGNRSFGLHLRQESISVRRGYY